MAAPKGNDNAKKLKDKKTKNKVYKDYCEHIAKGWSHKSWHYNKDGLLLTWETIENYIKEDVDFDPIHKKIAVSESLRLWEETGIEMMLGNVEKCQPAIYQMNMRNRFSWDKETQQKEDNKGVFNNWIKQEKE